MWANKVYMRVYKRVYMHVHGETPMSIERTMLATALALLPLGSAQAEGLKAWAKVKTDKIDAAVLAKLHASGFLPKCGCRTKRTQACVASWLNESQLSRR